MKSVILFFLVLVSFSIHASTYRVDVEKSSAKWKFNIDPNPVVYGEVPIIEGDFVLNENVEGRLEFGLNKTKSYELDEKEKDFSDSRDERIYDITGATTNPVFIVKEVKGFKKKGNSSVEIRGMLTLNGITKEIALLGKMAVDESTMKFAGKYTLQWKSFNVGEPIMWFMKAFKTASKDIEVDFYIEATIIK